MPIITFEISQSIWNFLNKKGVPEVVAKNIIQSAWEMEGVSDRVFPLKREIPVKYHQLWDWLKMRCGAKKDCDNLCEVCRYTRQWRNW